MKHVVKRLVLFGVLIAVSGCGAGKDETATDASSKTKETTSSTVEKKDVSKLLENAGYTTNVNNGLRTSDKTYYFLAVYIENVEEGYTIRSDVYHDGTVSMIKLTNKREDIDGVIYTFNGRYGDDQELIDDYLGVLKKIGIDKEEMMDYLIAAAEENTPDEEWIRKNTDMLSSTDSSETQNSQAQGSQQSPNTSDSQSSVTNEQSDIKTKIQEIDAKYDEMIERVQGYIDNSASYDDTMALTLSIDYLELLEKYAELTYETGADGAELTDSDTLAIFNTLATKNVKLTELYTKLSS